MKIQCPNCNQEYDVDNSFLDKSVACAKCGEEFTVSLSLLVDAPLPPMPPAAPKPPPQKQSDIPASKPERTSETSENISPRKPSAGFFKFKFSSVEDVWPALGRVNLILAGLMVIYIVGGLIQGRSIDLRGLSFCGAILLSLVLSAVSCFTVAKHLKNQREILESQREIIKLLQTQKSPKA